ncbi:hypothetical protein D3C87_2023130 [compost metagenome]
MQADLAELGRKSLGKGGPDGVDQLIAHIVAVAGDDVIVLLEREVPFLPGREVIGGVRLPHDDACGVADQVF